MQLDVSNNTGARKDIKSESIKEFHVHHLRFANGQDYNRAAT